MYFENIEIELKKLKYAVQLLQQLQVQHYLYLLVTLQEQIKQIPEPGWSRQGIHLHLDLPILHPARRSS